MMSSLSVYNGKRNSIPAFLNKTSGNFIPKYENMQMASEEKNFVKENVEQNTKPQPKGIL